MYLPNDNILHYVTETGALISKHDYQHLSDDQKKKCKPVYKTILNETPNK